MKKLISKVVTVATYKGEDSNSINVLTGTSFILPLNLYKDIIISIINCFLPFNLQLTIFHGNYPLNSGLFFSKNTIQYNKILHSNIHHKLSLERADIC